MKQIKELHKQQPIKLHENKPASADDLKELLNRLASYHSDYEEISRPELKDMFEKLSKHYKTSVDEGEWDDLPMTIGQID